MGATIFQAVGADASMLHGTSWWPLVTGDPFSPAPAVVSEILTDRAVIAGHWKLVSSASGAKNEDFPASGAPFQLYNLMTDPTEQTSLVDDAGAASILEQMKAYLACHDARFLPGGGNGCDVNAMDPLKLPE